MAKYKAVVVTTEHRGVFYGFVPDDADLNVTEIRLERAKMCVYWTQEVHGVLGLASTGPMNGCRVSPEVPVITLQKVTAIMEVTPAAEKAWEKIVWLS